MPVLEPGRTDGCTPTQASPYGPKVIRGETMYEPLPFALGQVDRLMNFFPRGDTKATALFAFNVALLSLLALNFPYTKPTTLLSCLAGATLVPIVLSLRRLYAVFFPDLKPADTHSAVYFGDIAKTSVADYAARLKAQTEEELLQDLACQIHRNSQILAAKFDALAKASIYAGIAIVPWLIFVITVAVSGTMNWGG